VEGAARTDRERNSEGAGSAVSKRAAALAVARRLQPS
jgi:hypothetical protein